MKLYRTSRLLLAPFFSVLASVFMTGCSKDNDDGFIYSVPLEYQTFVDTFLYEATLRGYSIEIKSLIINFDATLEEPHCGRCNSTSLNKQVQKIISINPNIQCWFTTEQQETLVFHELGHCILGRQHEDGRLPNGDFKSLLNSNDLSVYSSCVYPVDNEPCDDRYKRPYYLDELFDEKTPVPDWGN